MKLKGEDLKVIVEQVIDFKSFRINGYPLKEYFKAQGWMNFFDMLNGPTFPYLVKYFQVRVEVFDEGVAAIEESQKIAENKDFKGKSRDEMGLNQFKEMEIKSVFMGVEVTTSQNHIAKLMGIDNKGRCPLNTKDDGPESSVIKQLIFLKSDDFGKVKNMKIENRLLFRILIGCLIPREWSAYQISWDHKHFIWFLINMEKINLPIVYQ